MKRVSLHPGVLTTSLGFTLSGLIAVKSSSAVTTDVVCLGYSSVAVGAFVAIWGVKFKGEHWWRPPKKQSDKQTRTKRGYRLVESLRIARGTDTHSYLAHIEFLSSAQRELAIELDAKFRTAGWSTNLGSVPHDRYSGRHGVGIEVSGYNKHIVDLVTEILNALGAIVYLTQQH